MTETVLTMLLDLASPSAKPHATDDGVARLRPSDCLQLAEHLLLRTALGSQDRGLPVVLSSPETVTRLAFFAQAESASTCAWQGWLSSVMAVCMLAPVAQRQLFPPTDAGATPQACAAVLEPVEVLLRLLISNFKCPQSLEVLLATSAGAARGLLSPEVCCYRKFAAVCGQLHGAAIEQKACKCTAWPALLSFRCCCGLGALQ